MPRRYTNFPAAIATAILEREEVSWDYGRAPLSRDVYPGEIIDVEIRLQAPATVGHYIVEFVWRWEMQHEVA